MIQRPCTKCLVKTVCNQPCDKIRRRAYLFNQAETIMAMTAVVGMFIIFTLLIFYDKNDPFVLGENIAVGIIMYAMVALLITLFYIRPQLSRVYHRFDEYFPTGMPMSQPWKTKRPIKPPPPPPPRKH